MSSGLILPGAHSMSEWQLIEPICVAFEEAWHRGHCPSLDDFLQMGAELPRQLLLEELLRIELFFRRSAQQPIDAKQYITRFPDAAALIEQVFAAQPPLPSRVNFVPQAVIGRYEIVKELGRGSFGVVYLAYDQQLGRDVAIKIPGSGLRASPRQLLQLLEEARAAARLRHPGIVSVYDVQPLSDGGVYVVLEFIEGKPLSDYEAQSSDFNDTANLFAEIADAIAYAHTLGFVHRDLHPQNILIDEQGSPHVLDFGLAVHEDQQRWRAGERAGSLLYMAPEQVRGESHRLDGRADVWAMGAMLYEALTGRRAFDGPSAEHVADEILHRAPKPPRQIRAAVPVALERICLRCLAKKPEERFSTAGDLANALRGTMANRPRHARRIAVVVGLMIVASCGMLAWGVPLALRSRPVAAEPARLDLLVWKNGKWNSVRHNPSILPLGSGDQLRIEAQTDAASYFYIVWIDAQGMAAPVFPWIAGQWQQRATEQSHTHIALPDTGPDEVWPMQVERTGYEFVLLLARPTPLPVDVDLAAQFAGLPPVPVSSALSSGARFDYQQLQGLSSHRALDLARRERIDDPLVRMQVMLKDRLDTLFPEMECLVIPVAVREQ